MSGNVDVVLSAKQAGLGAADVLGNLVNGIGDCGLALAEKGEKSKRSQPPWRPPDESDRPVLKVYNSFTRKKEVFRTTNSNRINWYSCGPTVYDVSHMGHARSYITFDILRRICRDYFGYSVFYVMNITDIDDKIIKRSRQEKLLSDYSAKPRDVQELISDCSAALSKCMVTISKAEEVSQKERMLCTAAKFKRAIDVLEAEKCSSDSSGAVKARKVVLEDCKDIMYGFVDGLGSEEERAAALSDNAIYESLPRKFEDSFHDDMRALNVLPADCLTRVSEYIPEVIQYILTIVEKGYAYESNGSVYFDVAKFDGSPKHSYAKLVPEAYGDNKALWEGEGDLSLSPELLKQKRSANDFALWKASKPGEPKWESPWGMGRPGWHIECSVMASSVIGGYMDIHTGGCDLKFPHHDNEIAQAEAYYDRDGWVNYFLHSGHLTISGCKMSKSLKNFITIADALQRHTARQIRFMFLLHSWRDTLDYSDDSMEEARRFDKLFNEFFMTAQHLARNSPTNARETFEKHGEAEELLVQSLHDVQNKVHESLCDSFDTKSAMMLLRDVVSSANKYMEGRGGAAPAEASARCNVLVVKMVAEYVTRMMKVFGVVEDSGNVGFSKSASDSQKNKEEIAMPYVCAMANLRHEIRLQAMKMKPPPKGILKLCDDLRDEILPDLGVRLEDVPEGQKPIVKVDDRERLMLEKKQRKELEAQKQEKKKQQEAKDALAKAEREELRKLAPEDMFKDDQSYTLLDDNGIPTHDENHKELTKSHRRKLEKRWNTQKAKHDKYNLENSKGNISSDTSRS